MATRAVSLRPSSSGRWPRKRRWEVVEPQAVSGLLEDPQRGAPRVPSSGPSGEVCGDVLRLAAPLEDGALPLCAGSVLNDLQHALEFGLAPEIQGDRSQGFYEVQRHFPGCSATSG